MRSLRSNWRQFSLRYTLEVMTRIELQQVALTLPSAERIELIHALWESLPPQNETRISAQEMALIDEGIREYEANPDDVVPWSEVEAELWPKR